MMIISLAGCYIGSNLIPFGVNAKVIVETQTATKQDHYRLLEENPRSDDVNVNEYNSPPYNSAADNIYMTSTTETTDLKIISSSSHDDANGISSTHTAAAAAQKNSHNNNAVTSPTVVTHAAPTIVPQSFLQLHDNLPLLQQMISSSGADDTNTASYNMGTLMQTKKRTYLSDAIDTLEQAKKMIAEQIRSMTKYELNTAFASGGDVLEDYSKLAKIQKTLAKKFSPILDFLSFKVDAKAWAASQIHEIINPSCLIGVCLVHGIVGGLRRHPGNAWIDKVRDILFLIISH